MSVFEFASSKTFDKSAHFNAQTCLCFRCYLMCNIQTILCVDWYQTSKKKIVKYVHIHIQAYTYLKKITDCLIYYIVGNGEVIKYQKFISVVVIELSVRCLNTGPENRLSHVLSHGLWAFQSYINEPRHEIPTI